MNAIPETMANKIPFIGVSDLLDDNLPYALLQISIATIIIATPIHNKI